MRNGRKVTVGNSIIFCYTGSKRGVIAVDIGEAFCARVKALIEEIRGYMEQLPDGPEMEEMRRQLEKMERILAERFG